MLGFVGRLDELAALRDWVLNGGCRLVAVLGMGGIGKTALAARLGQSLAPNFQRLYSTACPKHRAASSFTTWRTYKIT